MYLAIAAREISSLRAAIRALMIRLAISSHAKCQLGNGCNERIVKIPVKIVRILDNSRGRD
jgi:hypothetical protein